MRAEGEYPHGAITICQAPILIIGAKDNLGKIIARSLLIPIKKNKDWVFELKKTYGERILAEKIEKDFVKEIEKIIGEGKVKRKVIESQLPKSRKIKETEKLEFWRDEVGLSSFKELK
jgi:hypothetical protein